MGKGDDGRLDGADGSRVTADFKARIASSTAGTVIRQSATPLPAKAAAPSRDDVLTLLIILAILNRQSAPPAPEPLRIPAPQPLALDRGAVVSFVGQAVQDQVVATVADRALDFVKSNAEAAAASAIGGALGIEGIASAGGSVPSVLPSLAAAAPVGIVATVLGGLAIAGIDIFGGGVDIPTYATTPQLDATTQLGQAAARKAAIRIKTNLAAGGVDKFGNPIGIGIGG
jgi:hypothetical protein